MDDANQIQIPESFLALFASAIKLSGGEPVPGEARIPGGRITVVLMGVVGLLTTLAAIVLHAVAIILGLFAPAIHSLRLNFVEFFSTFIEPGGRKFDPLHK